MVGRAARTGLRTAVPDHERTRRRTLPLRSAAVHPSFQAGSTDNQAGAFTPFALNLATPRRRPGAGRGSRCACPPGSRRCSQSSRPAQNPRRPGMDVRPGKPDRPGHRASGLGPEPVQLTGQVYLTSRYDGAPFGLLVRTPPKAGPFDLGYVNVRSTHQRQPAHRPGDDHKRPRSRDEAIPTCSKASPSS